MCQICSYITLLNSGLRLQKIAVILKICVGFRGAAPDLALTPDPLAKRLAPSALGIFFLPFPVLPFLLSLSCTSKNGVLRKLKHIFPNTYQRIKSICSPARWDWLL